MVLLLNAGAPSALQGILKGRTPLAFPPTAETSRCVRHVASETFHKGNPRMVNLDGLAGSD
jgi:hypothetical protein